MWVDTQETVRPGRTLLGAGLRKPPTRLSMWQRTWKWVTFSWLNQRHCGLQPRLKKSGTLSDLAFLPGRLFPPDRAENGDQPPD